MNYDELSIEEKEFVDELIFLSNLKRQRSITLNKDWNSEAYDLGAKAKVYTKRTKSLYTWITNTSQDNYAIGIRSSATSNLIKTYVIPSRLINF